MPLWRCDDVAARASGHAKVLSPVNQMAALKRENREETGNGLQMVRKRSHRERELLPNHLLLLSRLLLLLLYHCYYYYCYLITSYYYSLTQRERTVT